jgi:hypothetical protein
VSESAKDDLDKANVVVLAKAVAMADTSKRRGPAGYRPIDLELDVQRVFKGDLPSRKPCVTYFFPVGNTPMWVQPGSTGIFSLAKPEDTPCFRVVNDSRAFIRVYRLPEASTASLYKFVAEATVPQGGCAGDDTNLYMVAEDVHSITLPLVGSRAARKLLVRMFGHPDPDVRGCACLIAGEVWKLPEECLESVPDIDEVREHAERIKDTSQKETSMELQQLHDDPAAWLQTTVGVWGMDGALLRLGTLRSHSGSRFTKSKCAALKKDRQSVSFEAALFAGQSKSNDMEEHAAVAQFDKWVLSGCRSDWQPLENPLTDP